MKKGKNNNMCEMMINQRKRRREERTARLRELKRISRSGRRRRAAGSRASAIRTVARARGGGGHV